MEGKVAVLGSSDFTMPFSALGLDTYPVELDREQITESARKILDEKYALVVVAENVAPIADEVFEEVLRRPAPAIVVVPFTTESKGYATEALGEVLRMATGINILQND
ncbi:MAG: V-type ATP synthase subunit F [Planctomycetota bacterium]|jgi:vacuolar-type H+-ATPase subunit F/Vma7